MDILLESLHNYYKNKKNMDKLLEVINENKVSLRIIDWFVTNYSKKKNIYYEIYKNGKGDLKFQSDDNILYKQFNTYYSYKSQLKSFNKKKFDPFCRKNRIIFECKNGNKIETTIGQLNFFKWAIDNLVIEYIINNYSDIENDMNECTTKIKQKKEFNGRKQRQELSKSASRGLNLNNRKVILDFS